MENNLYQLWFFIPVLVISLSLFFFLIHRDEQEYEAIWGGRVPKWMLKKERREYNKKIKYYEKWIRTAYSPEDLNLAIEKYESFIDGSVFVFGKRRKAIIQTFPRLEGHQIGEFKKSGIHS